MTHHIPDEIINKIVLMARPKPYYIPILTNIGKIVAFKTEQGKGNCRVIDYMANMAYYKRLNKLKTTNHYCVLNQLKRLIIIYNDFKERTRDYHLCLGEWFKWWIYEDGVYTSSSEDDYSSEDDDNYDY